MVNTWYRYKLCHIVKLLVNNSFIPAMLTFFEHGKRWVDYRKGFRNKYTNPLLKYMSLEQILRSVFPSKSLYSIHTHLQQIHST
jgi:hypothetical protein